MTTDRSPHHRHPPTGSRPGEAGRLRLRRHLDRRPGAASRPAGPRGRRPADLHRGVLLRREHRHAPDAHRGHGSPASTSPPSRCRRRSCSASPACSRAGSLVLDVQDGYFDRLLLTPVRRLAILLGHMVADVTVACGADDPDPAARFRARRAVRSRTPRRPRVHRVRRRSGASPSRASATPSPSAPATPPRCNRASCCSSRSCSSRRRTCPGHSSAAGSTPSPAWNPVTYLLEGLRSLVHAGLAVG